MTSFGMGSSMLSAYGNLLFWFYITEEKQTVAIRFSGWRSDICSVSFERKLYNSHELYVGIRRDVLCVARHMYIPSSLLRSSADNRTFRIPNEWKRSKDFALFPILALISRHVH